MGIPLDKAELLALFLETLVYGMHFRLTTSTPPLTLSSRHILYPVLHHMYSPRLRLPWRYTLSQNHHAHSLPHACSRDRRQSHPIASRSLVIGSHLYIS